MSGDASAEILTGAGAGGGPHVRGFTGTGAPTGTSFFAYTPAFTGGARVAVGNLDAAGPDEIVTAAGPGAARTFWVSPAPAGRLEPVSSRTETRPPRSAFRRSDQGLSCAGVRRVLQGAAVNGRRCEEQRRQVAAAGWLPGIEPARGSDVRGFSEAQWAELRKAELYARAWNAVAARERESWIRMCVGRRAWGMHER